MEHTLYVVGLSRNDAALKGLIFESFGAAENWADENGLNIYKTTVWIRPEDMYEVTDEDE